MLRMFAKRRVVAALGLFWGLFCLWVAWGWLALHLVPRPESVSLGSADGYELRSYSAALAAQVQVRGSWEASGGHGTRLLRAFAADAMTLNLAPMVREQKSDGSWLMSLVLPHDLTDATVPRPDDPQVRIVTIPGRTVAVLGFSGGPDAAAAREQELRALLARDRVLVTGAPRIVSYDAPLVPPFLRRSELLLPVLP
jgi:hypothetical protein